MTENKAFLSTGMGALPAARKNAFPRTRSTARHSRGHAWDFEKEIRERRRFGGAGRDRFYNNF